MPEPTKEERDTRAEVYDRVYGRPWSPLARNRLPDSPAVWMAYMTGVEDTLKAIEALAPDAETETPDARF